jgi:hypothetical protein
MAAAGEKPSSASRSEGVTSVATVMYERKELDPILNLYDETKGA